MSAPDKDALTPRVRDRLVEGTGDTWALLPVGTAPVHITGLGPDDVTLVPGGAFVDAQICAEDRGRALALLNARIAQLGIDDPTMRRILDTAGYSPSDGGAILALLNPVNGAQHT